MEETDSGHSLVDLTSFRQMFSAACRTSRERIRKPSFLSSSRNRLTRSTACRQLIGCTVDGFFALPHQRFQLMRIDFDRAAMRAAISERELL